MRKKSRMALTVMVLIICLFVVILSVLMIFKSLEKRTGAEVTDGEVENQSGIITVDGKRYKYRSSNFNVLFMGVDDTGEQKPADMPGDAGQTDCLILLSLNKDTGEVALLQISRDSMTEIDIFDVNGNQYTTITAQIATQYAYAMGEKRSCIATRKQVQKLLMDIPIDGYFSMNLDGIESAVDSFGGMTVTLKADYTDVNPAYLAGETIHMDGKETERFVRYRDITRSGSNGERMERQVLFLSDLFSTIKEKMEGNESFIRKTYSILEPYIVTDLTISQLEELAKGDFQTEETQYIPGEARKGEIYEEYYVDEEALEKMLLATFYEELDS